MSNHFGILHLCIIIEGDALDALDARQMRTRTALIMAAIALSGSLDPGQIKVKDLAERAGVTRMTLQQRAVTFFPRCWSAEGASIKHCSQW